MKPACAISRLVQCSPFQQGWCREEGTSGCGGACRHFGFSLPPKGTTSPPFSMQGLETFCQFGPLQKSGPPVQLWAGSLDASPKMGAPGSGIEAGTRLSSLAGSAERLEPGGCDMGRGRRSRHPFILYSKAAEVERLLQQHCPNEPSHPEAAAWLPSVRGLVVCAAVSSASA